MARAATIAAVIALTATLLGGAVYAQDDVGGVAALREQAEAGDATAQFNLGVSYDNGQGVPQDYQEAVRWYTLAAEQGLALAQFNLGFRYANGEGVPQDDMLAHMWLNLAASKLTGERREQTVDLRDLVAERLTPAALMEAQRLAREWQPESP